MKSESWITIELLALLFALSALSFFFLPVYEKGAWLGLSLIGQFAGLVLGYKFGKSMPQQASDK